MADDSAYIQKCPFPEPPIPNQDIYTYLTKQWANNPEKMAVIEPGSGEDYELTYSQLSDVITTVSRDLRMAGLKHGDMLSIWCSNSAQVVIVSMATWRLGAAVAFVGSSLTPEEARRQIKMVNAAFLLIDQRTTEKLSQTLMEQYSKPLFKLGLQDTHELLALRPQVGQPDPDNSEVKINNSDTAVILFSSGTTGLPKAVEITHRNLIASLESTSSRAIGGSMPNSVLFLPMTHFYGLYNILKAFEDCAFTVIMKKFDLDEYLRLISKHKIWIMFIVPAVAVMMSNNPELMKKYDLSHVAVFMSSAAPLGKDIIQKLQNLLPSASFSKRIIQTYGMTEACGAITRHPSLPYPHQCPLHSVGLPACYVQIKIVDLETGRALPAGGEGELLVRGESVMKGYYGDQEATSSIIDKDGWLHTGDIGYYEDTGFIFIVDRAKEIIKCKGMQVAPADLEDVLMSHPDLEDAAVVGEPDELCGERPVGFVVKRSGSTVTEQQIINYVSERVAPYKQLAGGVRFVETIPKLPSGKILRRVLKESLQKSK